MKIQVDWFSSTGKWKYGGEVEIGDVPLWGDDFKQTIINNQNEIVDGWQEHGEFYVVTRDIDESMKSPHYRNFYHRLYEPAEFIGIKKQA